MLEFILSSGVMEVTWQNIDKALGDLIVHEGGLMFQRLAISLARQAAEHLRNNPPTGISQAELDTTIESLKAWSVRIKRFIKEVFDLNAKDPIAASVTLVEKVRELGFQPFIQPEPLPIIDEDEIALICWLAVDAGQSVAASARSRD